MLTLNLTILFGYLIVLIFLHSPSKALGASFGLAIYAALLILSHCIILRILAWINFIRNKPEAGKRFLSIASFIWLIGMPSCWGSVVLLDTVITPKGKEKIDPIVIEQKVKIMESLNHTIP